MIEGVTNAGAIPVLERLVQFTGQRHRLITDNIANLSTPNFRPRDVSVEGFQQSLGAAIDQRRAQHGDRGGRLDVKSSEQVEVTRDRLVLRPEPSGDNIMFHDGNDRDLERTMQSMVENFMTFRVASEALRSRFDTLNAAIRERL